jgi:NAD+-dependent farnesol dehydrogenase
MRVLVTGGTGYIGAAIVRALARDGHTPIVYARHARHSDLPGELIDGDVRDRAALTRAADGVDVICHTAALVSIWRPRAADFDEINIGGLDAAIDVCTTLRIPRLVYTSSFLACPPHGANAPLAANDYQRTKAAALVRARAAAARGVPIVTLIPGVVYGPSPSTGLRAGPSTALRAGTPTEGDLLGRLVRDHLAWRLPGLVGADRIWSFTYIDDVAKAHVAALTRGSEWGQSGVRVNSDPTVGIAEFALGGENAPQMRAFEILRDLTGTRLPLRLPYSVATILAGMEEARSSLFKRPPLLTRGVVDIFRHDWPLDGAEASRILGYAITPLATGLQHTFGHLPEARR